MENNTNTIFDNGYESILQDLKQVADKGIVQDLQKIWTYLEDSETLLIDLINGQHPSSDAENGNIEFGGVLYIVDKVLDDSSDPLLKLAKLVLEGLGLPKSNMTAQDIQNLEKEAVNGPGIVAGDGTLYSDIHFGQLDPGWILAVARYVHYRIFPEQKASFGNTPLTPSVQIKNETFTTAFDQKESITIAVFGDWGTGPWNDGLPGEKNPSPSELVGKAIAQLNPDISMHLGDVYYAGTANEENIAFLPTFPKGKLFNFTLNSNHEAYDGSNGYFNVALQNKMFSTQQGTSYFAFSFQNWLIIGLDSAYYDESFFVMQGGINQQQIDFIKGLNPRPDQKVLLFTHHTAVTANGKDTNNAKDPNNLYAAVYTAFDNKGPDYWYYGHTHNAMVYNHLSATSQYPIGAGNYTKIRCVGNAAIPFGNGYELCKEDGQTPIDTIDYYSNTPMPNPDKQQTRRVRNGFAILTLSKNTLQEDFYEVEADGNDVKIIPVFSA